MRILHLAFEDHLRPGSGGGSSRNREVNRRLAADHEVTVVAAAFPGCESRVEHGVRYRHVGRGGSYVPSLLSYFAALPGVVSRARKADGADLVVEEFAPPASTMGVAAWSGLPTCANVQWFFARDKAREYRLPPWSLGAVERWGTRRYHHVVAVSEDLATQIRGINPHAQVTVNPMGVSVPDLRAPTPVVPRSSLFLGRLDVDHKGLDLLLDALALLPPKATTLTLAGDGRGRDRVEEQIRRLGLGDRVRLVGNVSGDDKWRLVARSQVVVMPSRRETFGLSALEALAVRRPVLAFDIPCLRGVVAAQGGTLVRPFDVPAFAASWASLLDDPARCDRLGSNGSAAARSHTWDDVAACQAAAYVHAAGAS